MDRYFITFLFANPNQINIFPSAGPELVTRGGIFIWMMSLINHWQYFIVPAVVLAYSTIVYLTQMTYELLHEELQKPYVTTLRAKGASENSILGIYVMKNVLVPVLVGLMSVFPVLVGGSVIIDFLFFLTRNRCGLGTGMRSERFSGSRRCFAINRLCHYCFFLCYGYHYC
ncbi:MAG: ABC transporter permease subunit [Bacteroidetes bacterium]|nr:ABC transporter permease subunit [Bacteroidota bacterium]